MDWRDSGVDHSFLLEFRKDGEFVIPDTNSVRITVRGADGVAFSGFNPLSPSGIVTSSYLLTIPQAVNTMGVGALTERRFVRYAFTSGGTPVSQELWYGLRAFVPLTVGPQDVRAIFGVRDTELPDNSVDTFQAYLDLLQRYPGLAAALTAVDGRAEYANRAIAVKTALTVFPSLPVRALKEESLANAGQIRANIDWEKIESDLITQLDELLELQLGLEPAAETLAPSVIFLVTSPTDPITNA